MPRPRKCRKVCCLPWNASFGPTGAQTNENEIVMSVDEYETIRLIDLMGFTQEECAAQMNVARTTVQGIYNDAMQTRGRVGQRKESRHPRRRLHAL